MFVLYLNPMTDRCEVLRPVARATTREALAALVERERDPHESQGPGGYCHETESAYKWHHSFRAGGPLEWFNEPFGDLLTEAEPGQPGIFAIMSEEEVVDRARQNYREQIGALPEVS